MKKSTVIGVLIAALLLGLVPATVTAQTPPLTETFAAFGLSVNFPADWSAREHGAFIEIVTDVSLYAMFDNEDDDVAPPGEFALRIVDPAVFADAGLLSAGSAMDALVDSMSALDWQPGQLAEISVGDWPGIRRELKRVTTKTEAALVGFQLNDESVVVALMTARIGELASFEDAAAAILASIQLADAGSAVDMPANSPDDVSHLVAEDATTRTFAAQGLTVTTPQGWVMEVDPDGILLASSQQTLDDYFAHLNTPEGGTVSPGEALVTLVGPFTPDDLGGMSLKEVLLAMAEPMTGYLVHDASFDTVTLGEYAAETLMLTVEGSSGVGTITLIGFEVSADVYLVAFGMALEDDYAEYEPIFFDIIASFEYAPEAADGDFREADTGTVSGLGMTVRAPEGWVADVTDYTIKLGDSPDTWVGSAPRMEPGQLYVGIFDAQPIDAWEGMTLPEVVSGYADVTATIFTDFTYAEPVLATVDATTGYSAMLSIPSRDVEGEIVGIETPNGYYVVAIAFSYVGEHADNRVQFWRIIESVNVLY